MADTLTLAGTSVLGLVPGTAQVLLAPDGDVGSPTPDTASVSSLLLDGDVITGNRYSNRHFSLPFVVFGTSRANLSATVDAFLLAVSAQTWQMVWTPNACPSTVWNCYRATPHVEWSPRDQTSLAVKVTLEFDAQPFGFSAGVQTTTVNATGGPTSLQVDGMNSGSFTTGTLDTGTKYEGAGSCKLNAVPSTGGRTITSTNVSAYATISIRVKLASGSLLATWSLRLQDSHGASATVTVNQTGTTSWVIVQFPLASFTGLDLTTITSWQISVDISGGSIWADDLRVFPPGSVGNTTAEGTVLTVPAIYGSARTPVALAVSRSTAPQISGNLLTAADSSFETGSVGTFVGSNATLAVAASGLQGTHSLQLTASSAATMSAHTANSGTMMAVAPSTAYTLIGSAHANVTIRSFQITVTWYDATGASISSNSTTAGNDVTSGWATQTANVTSPSNAAFAAITVTVTSPANAEVHLFDAVGLIVGSSQPWIIGTGTYQTVGTTMTNLLLHSPPATQDPDLTTLAGLAAGAVTIPDANMNYDGTYSVVAFFSASVGGATSRVITVTITQKVGTTTVGTTTITKTLIGTQTIASIGEVVLPITGIPIDNMNGSVVINVSSSNGTDAFSDVALCDTEGQTVMLTGMTAAASVYVDAPDPTVGVGPVYASTTTDRTNAVSVASLALISGGPIQFEPGSNKLLAASTNGAPNVTVTYPPAWLHEALV